MYLPLSRLLNLAFAATRELHVGHRDVPRPSAPGAPYVIGIGGSVAAGKSTIARMLQALLARWPDHPRVDLVTTDGFLFPNAMLEGARADGAQGLPRELRRPRADAVPRRAEGGRAEGARARVLAPHLRHRRRTRRSSCRRPTSSSSRVSTCCRRRAPRGRVEASVVVSDFFDFSIYVDATEDRSRTLVHRPSAAAPRDVAARSAFVLQLPHAVHARTRPASSRQSVWTQVNLVNLRENIAADAAVARTSCWKRAPTTSIGRACGCGSSNGSTGAILAGRTVESGLRARRRTSASSEIQSRDGWSPSTGGSGRAACRPTDSAMPTIAFASIWRCASGAGISISVAMVSAAASRISSTMRANSGSERSDVPNRNRNADRLPTREAEVGAEAQLRRVRGRDSTLRGRLRERVEQPTAGLLEQLDVQRALAREVLVEHGLGDARRLRDVVHRRRVEALLANSIARDVQELAGAARRRIRTPPAEIVVTDARLQRHLVPVAWPKLRGHSSSSLACSSAGSGRSEAAAYSARLRRKHTSGSTPVKAGLARMPAIAA